MAKVQIKSKEAKARAAASGGKGKKKKWSKEKNRDQLNNHVMFSKDCPHDKLEKEIPKMKLVTIATVSERLKVTGSLARIAIDELEAKGLIKKVIHTRNARIYTRASSAPVVEDDADGKKKKKKAAAVAEE
eukprot:CAMPEP_0197590888 /NCGR_PEP_ID=MMETSP1326-20131121/12277_1 /TAXON_ID=1155430 /ORGANISM="Genus nov. species nov., Strain RCC2288" /LENGTH=130 /DNA_ID=CAMNT_0043156189 /DNA_START=89 /DNA_END=481 /DNA_ORIENTATION=-